MIQTKRKGEWFELVIPKEWAGFSVEKIFRDIWEVPSKQVHLFKTNKKTMVNGEITPWHNELKNGDTLQIKLFEEEDFGVLPQYSDLEVLYEDEHLLVVNKPANMNTHPNEKGQTDTLANTIAYHLMAQGEYRKIKHIHRLDRDTTGTIIFAKHTLAGVILDKMLEKRLIKRTYLALVHGIVKQKKRTIDLPIGRDRHHPTRRRVSDSGQSAVTHYAIVEKLHNQYLTLVKCQLDTGRTHQIRVHLSHIGHPLAGDELYGGKPIFNRPALHAAKLQFNHPLTLEEIVCHAPFVDQPAIFKDVDPYLM